MSARLEGSRAVERRDHPPLFCAAARRRHGQGFCAGEKGRRGAAAQGDPFIDAQDWEIENVKTAVKPTGANTAVATVSFVMFMEPRTVTLDLVNTPSGWRIAEIRAASGSLRALYKLK